MRTASFAVGVDADFDAIRRHRSFVNLCAGDIRALPFGGRTFDLVTANMVVEHLDDPVAQFSDVARVLRPGGVFLFHTPNARSYITTLARLFPDAVKRLAARILENREAVDVYPTFYRANHATDIARIASRAGLNVEQVEYVNSTPAFSMFPPLLIPELLLIRQLQRRQSLLKYRAALVGVLRKAS